jgi:RHS repeat-associated protein
MAGLFAIAGSASGSTNQPLRFAARELDATAGLYYVRARWYDAGIGRFISEDPIGLAGGINNYAYAANNPVNLSDPTGLCYQGGWVTFGAFDTGAEPCGPWNLRFLHEPHRSDVQPSRRPVRRRIAGADQRRYGRVSKGEGNSVEIGRPLCSSCQRNECRRYLRTAFEWKR